jgi:ATP-dependent 26S proteasome regulatory subunit
MNPQDVLALWLALAAGRLRLRLPDNAGLRRLSRPLLAPTDADAENLDPQALATAVADGAERLYATLEAEPAATPLGRIAAAARLSAFDLELLALAALPCLEEDGAVAVASLNGQERRLRLGIALKLLLGEGGDPSQVRQALRQSPLWRLALLRGSGAVGALEMRLEPTTVLLAGLDGAPPPELAEGWSVRRLPLASAASASPQRWRQAQKLLELAAQVPLHLVGSAAAVETVLALAAGPAGALLIEAPAGEAAARPPWAEAWLAAVATGQLVALRSDDTAIQAPPAGLAPLGLAPVGLAAGGRWPLLVAPASAHLRGGAVLLARLELGGNDPLELATAWQQALNLSEAEADQLAGRTWLAAPQVAELAAGITGATADERLDAALERLQERVPPRAAGLAHRRQPEVAWQRLVLAADTGAELEELVRRVQQRVRVQHRWGLGGGERGSGVVGLLHGPSGTGKTLAADAIATRLHLPLLSVDLSLVVSKYIGETEKNLSQVFDAAEGFAALLFFDEADALFGKRTGVHDAHDRYANIEVNYLLQRLEAFEGLALLSTNLLQGMDEAFLRRFDQLVAFRQPGIAERRLIWQLHLPRDQLATEVDLTDLACLYALNGGEIHNAALSAAYGAAAADQPISRARIQEAIRREYAKSGTPMPDPDLLLSFTPAQP